jgi:hypothetical protein
MLGRCFEGCHHLPNLGPHQHLHKILSQDSPEPKEFSVNISIHPGQPSQHPSYTTQKKEDQAICIPLQHIDLCLPFLARTRLDLIGLQMASYFHDKLN